MVSFGWCLPGLASRGRDIASEKPGKGEVEEPGSWNKASEDNKAYRT